MKIKKVVVGGYMDIFSTVALAKTALQVLVLALFVTLTPELVHIVQVTFLDGEQAVLVGVNFQTDEIPHVVHSVLPHMLCRQNREDDREQGQVAREVGSCLKDF